MDLWIWLLAAVIIAVVTALVYEKNHLARLYWDWDDGGVETPQGSGRNRINTDIVSVDEEGNVVPNLEFELLPGGPNDRFFWGTCTAAHQIEGKTNNQWTDWENTNHEAPHSHPDKEMPPHTKDRSGDACDHYRLFDHDAQLVKDLGCNAYRFSMEWSRLEPAPEEWNKDEFRHYHRELDELEKRGIVPMVTLHHFTEPKWFAEKGGFMDEKNIDYFVRFASMMLKEFGRRVQYWCTINEPEVYVTGGYINGNFPPGIKNSPRAGLVLRNLLMAHVKVYYQMKALPDGSRTQIGIVKDIFQFDPANALNPLDHFVANKLDASFNESILEFFRSGHFVFQMPGTDPITYFDGKAPGSNDFVGLNYYSHYLVKFVPNPRQPFTLCHPPGHIMTDMPYTVYPEGLYRALHRMQRLEKPIFVTENGIADSRDDRRQLFIRRYLYALHRAMKEGVNVRGYFYWTLMDNFEWSEGYTMKFGLYETNFDNKLRRLRPGSEFFKQVVQHFTGVKPYRPEPGLISPAGVSRLFPPSMRLHPLSKKFQ